LRNTLPYLFIIPAILALLLVEGYPIVYSLYLSVTTFNPTTPEPIFVGAANYLKMISDVNFWISVRVTLLYVLGTVTLSFLLGLAFAMLLFRDKSFKRLQTILILPIAVSPLIAGIFFAPPAIWDDVNVVLKYDLGIPMINVFDPNFAFTLIVISDAWLWTPLFMLVILSVLHTIPNGILEAAELHGASAWQTFRRVTLPMVMRSPVIYIVIAIRSIDAFRSFEIPFTWAGWIGQENIGTPIDTLSLMMYKMLSFPVYGSPYSYIATIALTLLLISLAVTTIILRFGRRTWEMQ
jgi:multiple sugar transport system permease protein